MCNVLKNTGTRLYLTSVCIILRSGCFRYYLSGTDMTLTDYDGRTALHIAAAQGSNQLLILIKKYVTIIRQS